MILAMQVSGGMIPTPPSPSAFEAYGFAGVIFASFFFLVSVVIVLSWRYFMKRDEIWVQIQEKRDQLLKESLSNLSVSHERAVERVAVSAEKSGDASAAANRETAAAVRELQREVQASHKVFGEETISAIFRRALRDVKADGK